jgi:hypothetical protein
MKFILSAALLGAIGVTPAQAGIITITDFTANAAGVTANPGNDLATASSVGVTTWTASAVVNPLGGLTSGAVLTLTNPLSTAIGGFIKISWDGGAFSDTTKTSGVSFVGDELDITGSGILTGPGVAAGTKGVLDLAFTQAGGAGDLISGSGSFVASNAVPEPSTWAMLLVGFIGLAMGARFRRKEWLNRFSQ